MKKLCAAVLASLVFLTNNVAAYAQSDDKRIQMALNALQTICLSGQGITVSLGTNGDIKFFTKGINGNANASITYQQIKEYGPNLRNRLPPDLQILSQRETRQCMEKYIPRILDAILGPASNGSEGGTRATVPDDTFVGVPAIRGTAGGWLSYTITTCQHESGRLVRCDGTLRNMDADEHDLAAFVKQRGGLRDMRFARFGIADAVDDRANTCIGQTIRVANGASGATGQFFFKLLPRLQTPFSIYFDGAGSSARSFVQMEIPFAADGLAPITIRATDVRITN